MGNTVQRFFRYVIPTMLAYALSGVYTVVDGYFVGRTVGDVGLAAINLAFPTIALFQAIGTGIGMGGAILYSVYRGKEDETKQNDYLHAAIQLLVIAGVVMTIVMWLGSPTFLRFFGAKGRMLKLSLLYMREIVFGAVFQILATGLVPLIRNLDGSLTAMSAMIIGFSTNIILDFYFVPRFGMIGAARATVMGQFLTAVICVGFLWLKRGQEQFVLQRKLRCYYGEIIKVGISPFGQAYSPNIILMIMNRFTVFYGGEIAVAAYAILSYVNCINHIGDGCQPLLSVAYGKGDRLQLRRLKLLSYTFSSVLAAICTGAVFYLRHRIPLFFGASPAVCRVVEGAVPIFVCGFLFAGFVRNSISIFYATQCNRTAYFLLALEPILLLSWLMILPPFFDMTGLWLSVLATQVTLAIVSGYFAYRSEWGMVPQVRNP